MADVKALNNQDGGNAMQHKPKPKVSDVDALMEPRGKKSMATTRTRKSKRKSKMTDFK